jgi:hypothetical protein
VRGKKAPWRHDTRDSVVPAGILEWQFLLYVRNGENICFDYQVFSFFWPCCTYLVTITVVSCMHLTFEYFTRQYSVQVGPDVSHKLQWCPCCRYLDHNWCICDTLDLLLKSQVSDLEFYPLTRLVAGFSPRRPGFAPRSVHLEFVVDTVVLRQVFLRVLRFSPC